MANGHASVLGGGMTRILKAGVIGAGVFGGYHATQWARAKDVTFVGVFDTHPERAEALAENHGADAFADEASLLARLDVVSICSPAIAHGAGALAALRAGVAAYVEKPIASDPNGADAIVAEARRRGLVVACGFLERVTAQALGLFDLPEAPLFMQARRLGLPSPRNLDVSVVLDLMIHDLDMALALATAPPLTVEADGEYGANGRLDVVDAEITFESGFTASLSASRRASTRERTLRLVYPSGEVSLDLLSRTLSNTTPFSLNARFAETADGADPLGASLAAFTDAVRGHRSAPLADAEDGARGLDLALAVEQAVGG